MTTGGSNPGLAGTSVPSQTGGLASSPLVPKPGESIDPKTGKPHQAGMTRAEVEAKRPAEAASSNRTSSSGVNPAAAAAAGATIVGSGSSGSDKSQGKALEDMGGKEQAARQLTGTAPPPSLVHKEGDPMHGVMDDLAEGFEKVVGMLPVGFKEKLAGVSDPKGKMSQSEAERRLSAQGEMR